MIKRRMGHSFSGLLAHLSEANGDPSGQTSVPLGFQDFRHCNAELVLNEHNFTARDEAIVDVNVDGLADSAIQLEHRSGSKTEQIADVHVCAAKHGRDLDRHVEHGFKIGCRVRRRRGIVGSEWHHVDCACT
jgi:hypothetical protein